MAKTVPCPHCGKPIEPGKLMYQLRDPAQVVEHAKQIATLGGKARKGTKNKPKPAD